MPPLPPPLPPLPPLLVSSPPLPPLLPPELLPKPLPGLLLPLHARTRPDARQPVTISAETCDFKRRGMGSSIGARAERATSCGTYPSIERASTTRTRIDPIGDVRG